MIKTKRAYEPADDNDGERFLVDRLWPRGRTKSALKLAAWLKDVAPTTELRQAYCHDPAKWGEFRRHYFAQLENNREAWEALLQAARRGTVTLVFGARDAEQNNAVVLKEFLDAKLKRKAT